MGASQHRPMEVDKDKSLDEQTEIYEEVVVKLESKMHLNIKYLYLQSSKLKIHTYIIFTQICIINILIHILYDA